MKTKLFTLLTVILLNTGIICAEKVQIGGLYYNLDDSPITPVAEVTWSDNNYSGLSEVNIPTSVTYSSLRYDVTSIGDSTFLNCSSLVSVTIPSSVTSIGKMAFNNCGNLNTIEIPGSVISIGQDAFTNCSALSTITVDATNSIYDSRDNCNAIIETASNTLVVGCQNTVIPNSVTSIGFASFSGRSNLTSIVIPNTITSIDNYAFYGCSGLTSLTIPNNVASIGKQAFNQCRGMQSLIIGSSVASIGQDAYTNCSALSSITVDATNSIYDSRDNCNAIMETASNTLVVGCKNTVIPNSATSIGFSAFSGCSNMTSLEIPYRITSIGDYSFFGCSGLTSITCRAANAPELGNNAFKEVDKSIPLYVPSGSIAAYQAASGWSEFTNIQAIQTEAPMFPDDPGTLTYGLELKAAVVNGDELSGYAPTGAGGYPAGTEVTVTAQDITGYKFVRWSDDVIDKTRTIVLNEATTLTALYSHSMIEIAIAANQWNFICLPPLGDKQYTEDMFTYDGLTNVQWGTYNGAKRAAGQSGWETPETFNALQGYILYSATAGTLRINAYEDEIRQGESGSISAPLTAYDSNHPENASWNFLGNPYSQGFSIAGLAAAGIESPITVWNGTAYSTYTPDIDDYVLQPYEAFFIQKAEGGAERITFSSEYVEDADGSGSSVADDKGMLPGYFSVSSSSKVQFSKGNLQYRASTNTWRFGNNQYDYVGSDNANISSTYDGWIDLFCWGTGNNPTLISDDTNDYSTFVDWGVNAISNGGNEANLWRTPTKPEWMYLFQSRRNASSLYGKANVNGINGVIVLPDNWQAVEGIAFISGTGEYAQNTYTIEQWRKMESAGAVFLPAAGFRDPSNSLVRSVGVSGDYWSSTLMNENGACDLGFSAEFFNPQNFYNRNFVLSVRLVR